MKDARTRPTCRKKKGMLQNGKKGKRDIRREKGHLKRGIERKTGTDLGGEVMNCAGKPRREKKKKKNRKKGV